MSRIEPRIWDSTPPGARQPQRDHSGDDRGRVGDAEKLNSHRRRSARPREQESDEQADRERECRATREGASRHKLLAPHCARREQYGDRGSHPEVCTPGELELDVDAPRHDVPLMGNRPRLDGEKSREVPNDERTQTQRQPARKLGSSECENRDRCKQQRSESRGLPNP